MSSSEPPRLATWLLGLILPKHDREIVIGDLVEEHALLATSLSPADASRWYWKQVAGSIRPVLWASFRRGEWLKTLGAAFLGYLAVAMLVTASEVAMSAVLRVGDETYSALSFAVGLPSMVLGGYVAASLSQRGAAALAVMTAVTWSLPLVLTGTRVRLWYQLLLVVIGPTAAIAGGRIRSRARKRSGE
jgi:hypothetical protein